jgi:hypothetical protein
MQRSCADVNSPYKRKCWTNSGGLLVNSLLWGSTGSWLPPPFPLGDAKAGSLRVDEQVKGPPSPLVYERYSQTISIIWLAAPFPFERNAELTESALSAVKKVLVFSDPSWDVTDQTVPDRELLKFSRPGRVWLVTSRLGTGKTLTFFYGVYQSILWVGVPFIYVNYALYKVLVYCSPVSDNL